MLRRVSEHLSPQTVADSTSDDDNNKKMYTRPPVPFPTPPPSRSPWRRRYGRVDNAAEVEQGFFADPQRPLPPGVTDAHRTAYLERGWVCLEAQLGEGELAAARGALEARFELEGEEGGSELGQTIEDPTNPGVRRLCNLMGKAPEFLALALHPAVLAFARLTIGPEIRWQ